jgi:GMP synthase-like glutamine amidotransferase
MLHPLVRLLDSRRETFDRTVMRQIAARKLPVFGIGVGMQLINVVMGGNLYLHIPDDLPEAIPHKDPHDAAHRHGLEVKNGSLMERVYGDGEIRVNSRHHMAIDELAPGFGVTARCPDGVIEAIEYQGDDWIALGTQFHPESDHASALDLRIFEEFIDAIRLPSSRELRGGLNIVLPFRAVTVRFDIHDSADAWRFWPIVSRANFGKMRLFKFRRDPTDPVERVDRFWHGRRLRLVAGLSVGDDFSSIRGVVVRAQGEGKYLRLEPIAAADSPLRNEWAAGCRAFAAAGGNTTEFEALKNDLATSQVELLNRLRTACGSAAESLLAVCVADPGLWARDFDGKPLYASFCNPEILSALSGVSVIDALPAKDLVAGGHGWPLTPLPCWLVAADRSMPMATHARLLVHVDRDIEVFYLPVSDGLDDEYPPIR